MNGIDPHPHDAVPEAHQSYAFLWELQNRHGVPCFSRDVYSWDILGDDVAQSVKGHVKRDYVIYVRAYDFGKYPDIYRAMEELGARVISLQEAEALILAGKAVPGVPGANG